MKSLILVTLALVVLTNAAPVVDEVIKQNMLEAVQSCHAELGTPASFMDKVANQDFPGLTHDEKCVLKCALVKNGIMTEAGDFDVAAVEAKMDERNLPAESRAITKECMKLKGADPCETAAISGECILSKMQ